jgi:NADPH2:quinone reductase
MTAEITMRALVMEGFGPPEQATLGELTMPDCGPEDVLVRLGAAGINPVDWKEMAGYLAQVYPPYPPRWAPGYDGAGIVVSVGRAVTEFAPGDRVVVLSDRRVGSGTLADYVRVHQSVVAVAPASIGFVEIASIPTAGLTAYQGLFRADMGATEPGQAILIHGASGGIGSFAIGFAHAAGLRSAATCRAANADYVRSLGAELAIDYQQEDIVAACRRWVPDGLAMVLDCTSGGKQPELLDVLAPGGRLVVVATLTEDGDIGRLTAAAAERGLSVHFLVMDWATLQADMRGIAALIDGGKMRMPEVAVYPLDRAAEAIVAMKAGGVRGKIGVEIAALE